MMSTRLAHSRSSGFSPNAWTSVVMFFFASGRLIARMAGLLFVCRNLLMSCRTQEDRLLADRKAVSG